MFGYDPVHYEYNVQFSHNNHSTFVNNCHNDAVNLYDKDRMCRRFSIIAHKMKMVFGRKPDNIPNVLFLQ